MAYVTVWRKPWFYLELLPQVVWTFVPSLVLLAVQWSRHEMRNKALALLAWIATVVGVHVALGAMGYPKLLRYVILATPATVLLFVLVTTGLLETFRERQSVPGGRRLAAALVVLAALGFGLEIVQGVVTPMRDNLDLIRPLSGLRGVDYAPFDLKSLERQPKEGQSP
jgi:cytochrome c biogenesis factor